MFSLNGELEVVYKTKLFYKLNSFLSSNIVKLILHGKISKSKTVLLFN